jgi:hypothetical protein
MEDIPMGNIIKVNSTGIQKYKAYVAHQKESITPDPLKSDYLQHPLLLSEDGLVFECDDRFLEEGEEFKIAVPLESEQKARLIYEERSDEKVHTGNVFDFDPTYTILWVLAFSHPMIREGFDNPSNIKLGDVDMRINL